MRTHRGGLVLTARASHGVGPADRPLIRPLTWGEEATVEAVFAGLTPLQRWYRFHVGMPRLSPSVRRRLADVDGHEHVALVLEVLGQPVGIGRYHRLGPTEAEAAIAVAAAHVGQGHGRRLLEALLDHARGNGIRTVVFEILAENERPMRMARSLGADLVRSGRLVTGRLELGRPEEVARARRPVPLSGIGSGAVTAVAARLPLRRTPRTVGVSRPRSAVAPTPPPEEKP